MEQPRNYKKQQRRPTMDLTTMVYGKVPPQAKDMEVAVLGSCMLPGARNAFDDIAEFIRPECFYVDAHKRIFQAMQTLNQKGQPIDELTVVEQLKNTEELELVGGAYYIVKLTNSVVSTTNNEAYCRIILQKFIQRELIRISGDTITGAYEDTTDVFDLLEDHEAALTALTTGSLQANFTPIDTALVRSLKRIEDLRQLDHHITGVPSGFPALDRCTHGWQHDNLIILAARPSVGKTAFALQLARYAANNPIRSVGVGLFSLEMSEAQLLERCISAESEIWLDNIVNGQLTDEQVAKIYQVGVPKINRSKIFINDRAALNIFELRGACRRMKRKHDIGLIVIDYLQLMSGPDKKGGNREQEISAISRGLKQLAKELHVPIIALSQLSRAVENRTGEKKMPQLSDLRESGAIEQDADTVMFMYRPEYYDQMNDEMGESTKGLTEIKIAKNRQGALDTIKLRANLGFQKFYNWDVIDQPPPAAAPPTGGNWKPVDLPRLDTDEPF